MTKTKTKGESSTTAKIKELTGVKPEKISDEQLVKLQDVISNLNRMQMEIGILETRKHNLLHNIAKIQDKLTLMQQEFETKYGTTDINIQTGDINYPENGKADKKN